MGTVAVVIVILAIVWFARQHDKEGREISDRSHAEEVKRRIYELELKHLIQLQEFTKKDEMLIHLQKKVVPDRLDSFLSEYDILFLRGKPVRFNDQYYNMLNKLGNRAS